MNDITSHKRKICFVTGSRAEYGLMYWLMKEVQNDDDLQLQVIATGAHLSPEFGQTYKQIESDGFIIDYKVHMLVSGCTPQSITKSMGLGTIGFSDALDALQSDIIVILGDRYEALCVAQAALIFNIPIAHIHGGEASGPVIDETIRHAVTKLSNLHFTASSTYAKRVVQMGEHPSLVFNLGAPGLDHMSRTNLMSKHELENDLGVNLNHDVLLVTYHPLTLGVDTTKDDYSELFKAIEMLDQATIIFTYPNADLYADHIHSYIKGFTAYSKHDVYLYDSLGIKKYLSIASISQAVVGNSSSGLIEVPFLRVPTINIGDRQNGRLKANTVIDCESDASSIYSAMQLTYNHDWRLNLKNMSSPYIWDQTSLKIKDVLKTINLDNVTSKAFYDIECAIGSYI